MKKWVLDVGCGSYCRGTIGITLSTNVPATAHLDRWVGSKNDSCVILVHDVMWGLPFREGEFEEVKCIHALEHFENPWFALNEMKRVLKDGGKLVIVVPNPRKNDADWRDKEHKYSWTEASLRHLLEYLGFEVEKIELIAGGLDILAVCRKCGSEVRLR